MLKNLTFSPLFADEFQDKCLEAHNKLRGEHHAKKLQWNTELAESAKDWAKRVADKGYIQHSDSTRKVLMSFDYGLISCRDLSIVICARGRGGEQGRGVLPVSVILGGGLNDQ